MQKLIQQLLGLANETIEQPSEQMTALRVLTTEEVRATAGGPQVINDD